MASVYYVDAIPGKEEAVQASLGEIEEVQGVERIKEGNYDIAILVDLDEPGELSKWETNALRRVSASPGFKRVEDPDSTLVDRLQP